MNKVKILLEDDCEILGNGQGHVMYRQYLPVIKYIDLLNKYNIKSTFFVDMGHLFFLNKNKKIKDFKLQSKIIEYTITNLIDNQMDVQLHLHSQWYGAKFINSNTQVTDKWNIGQLSPADQKIIFNECFNTLNIILKKTNHEVISYKAGSWGLNPFNTLYEEFKKNNIKIVLGPSKGMKNQKLNFDYSNMENDCFPYYCDSNDINKIGYEKDIVIIPLTPTYLNIFDLIRYYINVKMKYLINLDLDLDEKPLAPTLVDVKKSFMKNRINASFSPLKTHMKINSQDFWYLKKTFKRAYRKIENYNEDYKLLVIETHTKDFINNFHNVNMFFNYLREKYSNLEFVTVSEVYNDIKTKKLNPSVK